MHPRIQPPPGSPAGSSGGIAGCYIAGYSLVTIRQHSSTSENAAGQGEGNRSAERVGRQLLFLQLITRAGEMAG